jgi:iron complex transport system substrate-binding protein
MGAGGRIDGVNAAALGLALLLAATIAWTATVAVPASSDSGGAERAGVVEVLADGSEAVRGGDGEAVRVADYHRIVSLVPEVDDALAALGAVDRLVAIGGYSREHSVYARHLTPVRGTVPGGAGVEDVLALKPDLVVVSAYSDVGRTQRLRAAGVPVFHLGRESGADDAALAVRRIAALCGECALGDRIAERFLARLRRVADPVLPRYGACYVECVGTQIFLASVGTNQSDVIVAAGFADAAAAAGYRGYGECRLEDLLRIAPAVIVAPRGSAATIAALPGSDAIPAVARRRIVEVDAALLSSPGLAMLDAAEAVAAARARLP